MQGFSANTTAMRTAAKRLDDIAKDLKKAGGAVAAEAVADAALGRLSESAALRNALNTSFDGLVYDLDRLKTAVGRAGDGVIACARNYTELDRVCTQRLNGLIA